MRRRCVALAAALAISITGCQGGGVRPTITLAEANRLAEDYIHRALAAWLPTEAGGCATPRIAAARLTTSLRPSGTRSFEASRTASSTDATTGRGLRWCRFDSNGRQSRIR